MRQEREEEEDRKTARVEDIKTKNFQTISLQFHRLTDFHSQNKNFLFFFVENCLEEFIFFRSFRFVYTFCFWNENSIFLPSYRETHYQEAMFAILYQ